MNWQKENSPTRREKFFLSESIAHVFGSKLFLFESKLHLYKRIAKKSLTNTMAKVSPTTSPLMIQIRTLFYAIRQLNV